MNAEQPTFKRIKHFIGEVCAVDSSAINPDSRLRGYGVDSIRMFELMLMIEDEFQVQLEADELSNIITIGELADYIDSRRCLM